jgi:hypothetical protein
LTTSVSTACDSTVEPVARSQMKRVPVNLRSGRRSRCRAAGR